jgi:hypothetical protein
MALLSGRGEPVGREGDCGWLSRCWSMALLSGRGESVGREGDCAWLSRCWSMALLSGRGEPVGREGDCGWLSRGWFMALMSGGGGGTDDAIARGSCLWEVSPFSVAVPISLIADTGVACVINHSES